MLNCIFGREQERLNIIHVLALHRYAALLKDKAFLAIVACDDREELVSSVLVAFDTLRCGYVSVSQLIQCTNALDTSHICDDKEKIIKVWTKDASLKESVVYVFMRL